VRSLLSTELAKPQTLANIREFGQGLATGLGNLIDIARGLPWGAIGDALKIGGVGAKAVLDAFIAMPPWVQTAIATGWGLNKLTGGAVSGIVGELGKGLIKGVLGMNAGVVNIKAGVVTGAGGVPGAGAGGGGMGLLGGGLALAGVAGIELFLADVLGKAIRGAVEPGNAGPLKQNHVIAEFGPVQFGVFKSLAQEAAENRKASQQIALNTSGSPNDRDEKSRAAAAQAKLNTLRDKIESA